MLERNPYILPALLVGLALIVSTALFNSSLRRSVRKDERVNVTGSARMPVTADQGTIFLQISSTQTKAADAYKQVAADKAKVLDWLHKEGVQDSSIEVKVTSLETSMERDKEGNVTGRILSHTASQSLTVVLADVQKIRKLSLAASDLMAEGIGVSVSATHYNFIKLAEYRVKIQAEASKDAALRAQKIVEAAGAKLGPLMNAKVGVIQLVPRNSTEVSYYGYNDVSSIDKEICTSITATFRVD